MGKSIINDVNNCSVTKEFTQIPNELIRNPNITAKAKVLLCIFLSNKDGWKSYISVIRKMMKEGKTAVENALSELKENGYVMRLQYRDKQSKKAQGSFWIYTDIPYTYEITKSIYEKLEKYSMEIIPSDLANLKGLTINKNRHTGNQVPGNPVPGNPVPGNQLLKIPTEKEKEKNSFIKKGDFLFLLKLFPREWRSNQEFKDLLKSFTLHRKDKRCPMTMESCKALHRELIKYDIETAKSSIEVALRSGWTGVFPDKISKPSKTKQESTPLVSPEQYIADQFGNNKWKIKRFNSDAIQPVVSILPRPENKLELIKSLYNIYKNYESDQNRNDADESDLWTHIIPDGMEIITKYCTWIQDQSWLDDIGPNLFKHDSKVFKQFLRQYQQKVGYDLFTGERIN